MATTRAAGPETSPVDDEFLHLLYRGGELLAAGKVIEAKDYLERAHKLQPKNEKGQNLLGLTYFKLGLFDRAAELYEMLVRDNPVDPTLRVNLGLVYLKTNALQRAVREFEVAVDLAPDHKKAHNYLGLALAQQHEYGRAREHFLLSGSEAMAEKMSRALAGESFNRPPPVQPAQARGFAELEGADVVREQGGEPVSEPVSEPPAQSEGGDLDIEVVEEAPVQQAAPPPLPPTPPPPPAPVLPASEEDWGAQFGLDEVPPSEAPSPEASVEAAVPAEEAPVPVSYPPVQAAEELAYATEPPVQAAEELAYATEPPAAELEQAPVAAEEVPVEAAPEAPSGGEAYPTAEPSVPVMLTEEVSEDGMPVLTAEPEDAEDLAAIAQHEAVPAQPPAEPKAPVEGASETPSVETAALAASGSQSQAEPMLEPAPSAEAMPPVAQEALPASGPVPLSPRAEGRGGAGRVFQQEEAVPVLGELAPALALAGASPERPFTVGTGGFSVRVEGEVLTRLDGLVAFTGQVAFTPEMKRFRGRTTDKPFGEGARRMVRASGRGVLFIEPAERRTFTAVDLGEESAYFRDECVFAFEEPVMFENGRVPSDVAPDLDLVHLRGNGKVLLSLAGPLRSVPVGVDAPATVPTSHLVGWQGNLTPRVVSLLLGPGGEILKTAVELSGEGFALICLPVR